MLSIKAEKTPVNEYKDNDKLIGSGFFHLLLFGKGIPQGSVPADLVDHRMNYYDCRFEKCKEFVGFLFDQQQRHELNRFVAKLGRQNERVFKKLGHLLNNEQFVAELRAAQRNPESEDCADTLLSRRPTSSSANAA